MPEQEILKELGIELDDDIKIEDLDQGVLSREDHEVDLDAILREVESIEDGEDEYV